ncbi:MULTISPECIES: aldehyde dehydrogenase family protein [unclassified Rhizobium]|uniref:aldehyde dehydrogenase family protein n=1 Tax=unclassified Rhizobium TaxID=2613769 RepID=UPI00288A2B3E|nr:MULTISPECIES: aldehyde dehydrogenase family protein [unclassified Rhizobium]
MVDLWIRDEGTQQSSGRYSTDNYPEDDTLCARVAEGDATDVDRTVSSAYEAFRSFGKSLALKREAWLSKATALVEKYRGDFVDILVNEVVSRGAKANFKVN